MREAGGGRREGVRQEGGIMGRVVIGICAACVLAIPAFAQVPDTVAKDTLSERPGWWARTSRQSGLVLSSGKTYNRVEGLPVMLGPVFHDSVKSAELKIGRASCRERV